MLIKKYANKPKVILEMFVKCMQEEIDSLKGNIGHEWKINLIEFEMDYLKYELGKYEK